MMDLQQQLNTTAQYASEALKRTDRLNGVIEHLKSHGQSTASAEEQRSQFRAMAQAYSAHRDHLMETLASKRS
jgi:lactam utilization protein B